MKKRYRSIYGKPCGWCDDSTGHVVRLEGTKGKMPPITISISGKHGLLIIDSYFGKIAPCISYCPACGRKLGEGF